MGHLFSQPLPESEYNGSPESVGYRLRYSRLDGRSHTLTNTIHDRVEREFTIEDLEEWTEYRIQVQAFNAVGPGPWSQTVVGRTRESGILFHSSCLRQSGRLITACLEFNMQGSGQCSNVYSCLHFLCMQCLRLDPPIFQH